MTIRLFFLLPLLFIFACSSTDDSSDPMANDSLNMDDMGESTATFQGAFRSSAHETSGLAKVNSEQTILTFENFMTDNGPVLEVYLATDLTATNYISLGDLQGINGTYDYALPTNVDFNSYKYVINWCVEFSVNFG